jgi:hypothetical protein
MRITIALPLGTKPTCVATGAERVPGTAFSTAGARGTTLSMIH